MRGGSASDLSSLARLAQDRNAELRPLLLRVQTQAFVSAPHRGRELSSSFEALALGLIPLVPDDVLAEAAALLRAAPDTPASVVAALAARLGHSTASGLQPADAFVQLAQRTDLLPLDVAMLVDLDRADVDLALASNGSLVLDGGRSSVLVERARTHPALAREMLRRADLGIFDRAALYAFGCAQDRSRTRRELASTAALPPWSRHGWPAPLRSDLLRRAELSDVPQFQNALAEALGTPADWQPALHGEAGRELVVLALLAVGLWADECIRVLLVLKDPIGRSVADVFHLAGIARSTAPAVAACIVAGGQALRADARVLRAARRDDDGPPVVLARRVAERSA